LTDFETFLAEALPPLGLAPAALVRRNIRRRVMRRMESLDIHEFSSYLLFLNRNPSEWDVLRPLFAVTISRFFRNRPVFDALSRHVLAPLAEKGTPVFAWSAGCASGEEAFTLRILWEELPGRKPPMSILATDVAGACLQRAREGLYPESSLREVPRPIVERHFRKEEGRFRLREDVVRSVTFRDHDLMGNPPSGEFHLVLCRNAAFTYFAVPLRVPVAGAIASVLSPGGFLVIGRTETLPLEASAWFAPIYPPLNIFRCLKAKIAPIP
jgi:chemotaxis protein methyltransferase CheR